MHGQKHKPSMAKADDLGIAVGVGVMRNGFRVTSQRTGSTIWIPNFSLKYKIVSRIPDSKSTCGSHPSSFLARVISGLLTLGSSTGSGLVIISDLASVISRILLAKSSIVISRGLPIFTGS